MRRFGKSEGKAHLQIQNPAFAERAMRALEIKGDLPQFMAEVFDASVQVADLTKDEYAFLRREILFQGRGNQPAVAAQFSLIALVGRAQTLCVVDRIVLSNDGAAAVKYGLAVQFAAVSGGTQSFGAPKDDRGREGQPGATIITRAQVAQQLTTGSRVAGYWVPANSSLVVEGPWVLSGQSNPGVGQFASLVVEGFSLNTPLDCTFVWRERNASFTEGVATS